MKNIWMNIIKPKAFHAKWLLLVFLAGVMYLWTQGYFDAAKEYLDTEELTYEVGSFKVSIYTALKALLSIIVVFWTTSIVIEFSDKRISSIKKMRISNKVLVQKILQIVIYIIAFLFVMNILGINLTSLAVFSGAIGIGLGFGLQKVAANFISGMILLFERALKPGDLVELDDGTFGFVRKSSSRSTLIETFDGKEILVPNEDFITKRVTNWTMSNNKARVDIPIGVSYGSNLDKVVEICLECAKKHERCLNDPEPVCWLREFGDSSVNFILIFWVSDVTLGRWNVQSEVMFDIWNKFKEYDIEIPFPQRDLNIRTSIPLPLEQKTANE